LNPAKVTLESERIRYWMDQGAKPSDTVRSILKKEGFFAATA
jgi:small subunit ribosomal protein S16